MTKTARERPDKVEVGQIWRDLDTRSVGAGEFEVVEVASMYARVRRHQSKRCTWIRIDRMLGTGDLRVVDYEYVGRGR